MIPNEKDLIKLSSPKSSANEIRSGGVGLGKRNNVYNDFSLSPKSSRKKKERNSEG